jgi:hypothetical protein
MVLSASGPAVVADEIATTEALPEDCLTRASLMVNPGEALTIRLFDGRSISGKLASFDLEKRLVVLEQWDELGAARQQASADDVQRYEYGERSGKGTGVAGAILGSAIGAVVGMSATNNGKDLMSGLDGAVGGMFIGGAAGYAVGSNMNSGYRPAGAIICDEE